MTRWCDNLSDLPTQIKQQILCKLGTNEMPKEQKNKYNNTRISVDDIDFDSKIEATRYGELILLQKAGGISELQVHPTFVLQEAFQKNGKIYKKIAYEADFMYIEKGKGIVVEDVKAWDKKSDKYILTPEFCLKQKLFEKKYPLITIKITGEG